MMVQWLELISVLACTLFTGAAFYITAVEHPARRSCGTDIAAAEWVPTTSARLSCKCHSRSPVISFTLIVIRPTNNRLLDPRRDRGSNETLELLRAWGRLHGVRTVLSLASSVLYVWAAIR